MPDSVALQESFEVSIDKLVYGGQGIGQLASGKKVFVWGALPGERVCVRVIRRAASYEEAIATDIIQPSKERQIPKDQEYLTTSPWQILNFDAENRYKKDITVELMTRQGVHLPIVNDTNHTVQSWNYRNKIEYSFADTTDVQLAILERGSHNKLVVNRSSLAMESINQASTEICRLLNDAKVPPSALSNIVIRSTRSENVVAQLIVTTKEFPRLSLPTRLRGLRVSYSSQLNSKKTHIAQLYELGECTLEDKLLGKLFMYELDTFFQINLPVFELALQQIKSHIQEGDLIDIYAGVGAIGLSVGDSHIDLIESDSRSIEAARINVKRLDIKARCIEASSEEILSYINSDESIILDPPRFGLHPKLTTKILEAHPKKIAYLSCNPATQARDLFRLQSDYNIDYFEVYNFFPRTPQIETLAILSLKKS